MSISSYASNVRTVTEYCAEPADRILALIIDRVLQIDVEIQVELEELEQDNSWENGDLLECDPFDIVVGQEGDGEESHADYDSVDSDASTDVSSDDGSEDELPSDVHYVQKMANIF